jgi:hypothetical protein
MTCDLQAQMFKEVAWIGGLSIQLVYRSSEAAPQTDEACCVWLRSPVHDELW